MSTAPALLDIYPRTLPAFPGRRPPRGSCACNGHPHELERETGRYST